MANRKINILYLIDYFHRTGGTERHLSHLVRLLPKERFECAVLAFDLGANVLLDSIRAHGVPVFHIPVQREYSLNGLRRARELRKLIRTLKPDIVQTYLPKSDTYGAVIAKLAGVTHLVSSKRDTGELRKPRHLAVARLLAPMFERVIVVAEAVRAATVANERIEPRRIVKIYNGVDAQRFAPPTTEQARHERQRLGLNDSDFVIGMVAGFRPEKCHDTLFEAANRALQAIPSLKMVLLGSGPLLEHYKALCAAGPLASRVTFTDAVDDVRPYLHAFDVACLVPGSNEGFSNAVLEAMAAGLPLVVTDIGGNAEAVRHQYNGLVIPPRDSNALANALMQLNADPTVRRAMGQRSREIVCEQFSLEQMSNLHQQLYRSIVEPDRQD